MKKQPRLYHSLCEVLAKQAVPPFPVRTESRGPDAEVGGQSSQAGRGLFVFRRGPSGSPERSLKALQRRRRKRERETEMFAHSPSKQSATVGCIHSPTVYFTPVLCQAR